MSMQALLCDYLVYRGSVANNMSLAMPVEVSMLPHSQLENVRSCDECASIVMRLSGTIANGMSLA